VEREGEGDQLGIRFRGIERGNKSVYVCMCICVCVYVGVCVCECVSV